jgi:hypothetical protein
MKRRELIFAFLALFLMSLTAITGVYAVENEIKPVELMKQNVDITGDGEKDEVKLTGVPYKKNENEFKEFIIIAKLSNGKTYTDSLESGKNPHLKLIDLNHDGIKDVLVDIPTGQSGGIGNHYLYSAKDFIFSKVPIPDLNLQGQFTNGYKAKISIPVTKESFVFDLMIRKEQYDSLGMYYNGKLNEPTELTILPYDQLVPTATKGDKIGLKGVQTIIGTSKTDTIAFVESTWYYANGHWNLVKTKVREANYE